MNQSTQNLCEALRQHSASINYLCSSGADDGNVYFIVNISSCINTCWQYSFISQSILFDYTH